MINFTWKQFSWAADVVTSIPERLWCQELENLIWLLLETSYDLALEAGD